MGRVLLGDLFIPVVSAGIFGGISWAGGWSGPKNPRQHHLDVLVPQCRHWAGWAQLVPSRGGGISSMLAQGSRLET